MITIIATNEYNKRLNITANKNCPDSMLLSQIFHAYHHHHDEGHHMQFFNWTLSFPRQHLSHLPKESRYTRCRVALARHPCIQGNLLWVDRCTTYLSLLKSHHLNVTQEDSVPRPKEFRFQIQVHAQIVPLLMFWIQPCVMTARFELLSHPFFLGNCSRCLHRCLSIFRSISFPGLLP